LHDLAGVPFVAGEPSHVGAPFGFRDEPLPCLELAEAEDGVAELAGFPSDPPPDYLVW
jgi:hypothetical protein